MAEEVREALVGLPREMGATKSALELSLKMGEYLVSLKIENSWVAGVCGVGVIGLLAFYIHRKFPAFPAERRAAELAAENPNASAIVGAIRNGLERNEAGEINPEVMLLENGSILVELVCHTKESLLTFLDDFEAQRIKRRLEREFRKLGCGEELQVTITNLDAVRKSLNQNRSARRLAPGPETNEGCSSTTAKANVQRLTRLLVCGGTGIMRDVFGKHCPPRYLPAKLKDPTVADKLKAAGLNRRQWECLYPSPGVYGQSKDFDLALLFQLLRTICGITPPSKGWFALPATTDASLAAGLVRTKNFCNIVYRHLQEPLDIENEDLHVLRQEIQGNLLGIAKSISRAKKNEWHATIDKILTDPLTADDEKYVQELERWYEDEKLPIVPLKFECERPEVLKLAAQKYLQNIERSPPEKLNGFVRYLQEVRKVRIIDVRCGSLIVTVECSSREIFEDLWEDYTSGNINKVANKYLVTEEILVALGLGVGVLLTTTIPVTKYAESMDYFAKKALQEATTRGISTAGRVISGGIGGTIGSTIGGFSGLVGITVFGGPLAVPVVGAAAGLFAGFTFGQWIFGRINPTDTPREDPNE